MYISIIRSLIKNEKEGELNTDDFMQMHKAVESYLKRVLFIAQENHWWCILVAKYGVFLFTEIGAFVITDYTNIGCATSFRIGHSCNSSFNQHNRKQRIIGI